MSTVILSEANFAERRTYELPRASRLQRDYATQLTERVANLVIPSRPQPHARTCEESAVLDFQSPQN
jgi:hypothetical protein